MYVKQMGWTLWYQFISAVTAFVVVILIATFLDALGEDKKLNNLC